MVLALFVVGLFSLLLLHTSTLSESIRESVEVQIFLDKNVTESNRLQINKTLASKNFILRKDNQPQITFITKEVAAEELIAESKEDFSSLLGYNPLRDSFVILVDPNFQSKEQLSDIKNEVEKISGVFEVTYVENLAETINNNLAKIALVLVGFAAILFVIVSILINNTIKLALFSQRFLIRSMQLVGATRNFIRNPFLQRAFVQGITAGLIASAVLYGLLQYAYNQVEQLNSLSDLTTTLIIFAALIILGGVLSTIGTWRSVNKYLGMSLDDLY